MIVKPNLNDGYNNHDVGYKLPIKWYYKWWVFIVGSIVIDISLLLILDVVFPGLLAAKWTPWGVGVYGFATGFIWGILRGKHIDKLKANKIYVTSIVAKEEEK